MILKIISWPCIALIALQLGCASKPEAGSDASNSSKPETNMNTNSSPNTAQKWANLQGAWTSTVAPGYPMKLESTEKGLRVNWQATMDAELSIVGELTKTGANVYSGKVDFSSGDESGTESLTLEGIAQNTLNLDLPVMFSEPIPFQRVLAGKVDCQEMANGIAMETESFQNLSEENPGIAIMADEGESSVPGYGFRAYTESESGEVLTLARYKVDFASKTVSEYDPIEDEYTDIEGSEALFEGKDCK